MKPVLIEKAFSEEDLVDVKAVLAKVAWRHIHDDGVRRNADEIHMPPLHWLHFRLRRRICDVMGLAHDDLMPSCIYALRYLPDSELRWHRDRPACELSMSVTVDDGGVPWPTHIKPQGDRDNAVQLVGAPGDGTFYHGLDTHGRKARPADQPAFTTVLFHYVSSNFRLGIL